MKKKYNLALIPLSKGNEVVNLAQQFSALADQYILGDNSLPHVTLYQFQAEAKEIDPLWKKIGELWKEKPINLEFHQFSCKPDHSIFWASLLPNQSDALHAMHGRIAAILELPIKQTFDPHMTLMNTRNEEYEKTVALVAKSYTPIKDAFTLSLGASDDVGQFIEVIYR